MPYVKKSEAGPIVGWGVSCEVSTEKEMGMVIAGMTVLGAKNIAWAPIRGERLEKQKDPAAVARGKLGGAKAQALRRAKAKGKKSHLSSKAVSDQFVAAQTGQFKGSALADALEKHGYSRGYSYSILNYYIREKVVRRVDTGVYQRIGVVKNAAAA